jgi:hypothetical protein
MARSQSTLVLAGVPSVNLMPPSEIARRQRAALTRKWLWGVLVTLLVVGLLAVGAFALKWVADQRLAAEQARTNSLLAELASLSEVSDAVQTENALTDFRGRAMASDFAWAPVFTSVAGILPEGVAFSGFSLITGGTPQGEDPAQEPGLTGVLRLESPTAIDIAATVRALRNVEGVLFADGQAVTSSQQTAALYRYDITLTFDQSIYSGAFAEEASAE